MGTKHYLPLLLGCLLCCGACQPNEPEPDYSGIRNLTYTLRANAAAASQTEVSLYPNPFAQYVNVQVWAQQGEAATIYFSDPKGKYSKKIELPDGNTNTVQVNFGSMPQGVYVCEVRLPGSVSRYRILKAD